MLCPESEESRNSSKLRGVEIEIFFWTFPLRVATGYISFKGGSRDLGYQGILIVQARYRLAQWCVQAYGCDLLCRREHGADSERLFCYIGIFRLCSCRVPCRNTGRRSGCGEEGAGRNSVGRFGRW